MHADNIHVMKVFPDFNSPGFDITEYNRKFKDNNVVVHASSSCVSYPEHWGCLSIKCAFHGHEYYQSGSRFYAVNDTNYLVMNEGSFYSSYIFSKSPVESFTVNFSEEFETNAIKGLINTHDDLLDLIHPAGKKIELTEKLYRHNELLSPVLFQLFSLSSQQDCNNILMRELYYILIERLLLIQKNVNREAQHIKAIKPSTRNELYKRLHYAKDFIDSCYMTDLSLEKIAEIAHLNTAYFLRSFKYFFKVTPYQYIIHRRLDEAKKLLEDSDATVTEVCFSVGYYDLTSFIKLFRNKFGLSPEKYQKEFIKKYFQQLAAP
jgi:AraC-like DNA-binding protein